MRKILVLCHGNINRSPLFAAALARKGIAARSAGFVNPGRRAAKKTREFAAKQGLDLEAHRSHVVTAADVRWASKVLCMDKGNVRRFAELFNRPVTCLHIPDPGFLPRGPKFESIMRTLLQEAEKL